jgi:WD40 repeat protein
MRTQLLVVVVGVSLLLAAVPVAAHHSFAAEFDAAQPVTLKGTVTKMEWINPHAWIHVEVKKPDGTVENWEVETGNPSALVRRGFTKNSLPPGTEIVVQGFRAKDGGMRANGRDLTFSDGKKLFVGSSGTGAPDERPER